MGDQVYAYRSAQYSSATSYDDAGRRKPDSYYDGGSDNNVCRTVISDRDGRRQTVYGCSPTEFYDTTEASHRRFGSPPPVLLKPQQPAHQYWRPSPAPAPASNRHRPQEVEEFLSGVQFEVSRRPNNQNNHDSRHYGDYRSGRGYGGYSDNSDEYTDEDDDDDDDYDDDDDDDDDDERNRHHVQICPRPTSPVVSRPSNYGGRAVPAITHGVGKLSLPTSNIDEAVDYLKLGHSTNNNYKTTTVETTPKPYGESGRPYGATNNTFGMNNYGTKYDQQPLTEHVKPYGTTGNYGYGGTPNPNSNIEISRPSYGTRYNQPTPEPAPKPFGAVGYGKPNNNLITTTSSTKVIDCYEAARRYNGTVIRT